METTLSQREERTNSRDAFLSTSPQRVMTPPVDLGAAPRDSWLPMEMMPSQREEGTNGRDALFPPAPKGDDPAG
ncbi:hypothetical protein M8R20_31505 [Pseudomonas sp. R2.Fl]|nr:hypothetical protein [Pseudomonas sp. R2.Fl]